VDSRAVLDVEKKRKISLPLPEIEPVMQPIM
jgi:hypothetical protein